MGGWALGGGGGANAEWFSLRFARARRLIPAAEFDTVIPADFADTITAELVDVAGVANADPVDGYNGGVVAVTVGDAVIAPSVGRLQLTGSSGHVASQSGQSWYAAALVRMIRPGDAEMGDTASDAIGLWGDDQNRVGLGLKGNGSGGSITNWAGYVIDDGSTTVVTGPALDGEESPVWHLFEMWFDVDAGTVSFALDGTTFDDTIAAAVLSAFPGRLSMISQRDAIGNGVAPNYDKACVIVASPRVGEIG